MTTIEQQIWVLAAIGFVLILIAIVKSEIKLQKEFEEYEELMDRKASEELMKKLKKWIQ